MPPELNSQQLPDQPHLRDTAGPPTDAAEEAATCGAGGRVTYKQIYRYLELAEMRFWSWTGKFNDLESRRLAGPEPWQWYWKPLATTVGYGLSAIALLASQFFVPWLGLKLNLPAIVENSGYIRLAMLLLAFILTAIAAPQYRPIGWQPPDDEQAQDVHDDFQRKIHR
jgi:hypothetical protein